MRFFCNLQLYNCYDLSFNQGCQLPDRVALRAELVYLYAYVWFTERMLAKAAVAKFKGVQRWLGRSVLIR